MNAKCKFCLKDFEAKRSTAQFCCDSHRVSFNNLSAEERADKERAFEGEAKSSKTIEVEVLKGGEPIDIGTLVKKEKSEESSDISERLTLLAKSKKTNVEDLLVWVEENYGKKKEIEKPVADKSKAVQGETYTERRFKLKTGQKSN